MTPSWHDDALSTLPPSDACVAWSVALHGTAAVEALARTRALPDDLTDAAHVRDGERRLVRRRLARALVARLAGCHVDTVWLGRSDAGAPIVIAPDGWHVGIAGRDKYCLIAVARHPIGVDRELVDPAAPVPWDMLSPAEARAVTALAPSLRSADWLRRWTIKEAHAKLIGNPRPIRPETIETVTNSPTTATATFAGTSACSTRWTADAVETVASWHPASTGTSV